MNRFYFSISRDQRRLATQKLTKSVILDCVNLQIGNLTKTIVDFELSLSKAKCCWIKYNWVQKQNNQNDDEWLLPMENKINFCREHRMAFAHASAVHDEVNIVWIFLLWTFFSGSPWKNNNNNNSEHL